MPILPQNGQTVKIDKRRWLMYGMAMPPRPVSTFHWSKIITGSGLALSREPNALYSITRKWPAEPYPDDLEVTMSNRPRCIARTQSGARCRLPAVAGNVVCAQHGGRAVLVQSRYSESLPKRWQERYQRALEDHELLAMRDEIALLDVRISDLLERLRAWEAQGRETERLWTQLLKSVEHRRRLVESERRRMIEARNTISSETLVEVIQQLMAILRQHVDRRVLNLVIRDVERLLNRQQIDVYRGARERALERWHEDETGGAETRAGSAEPLVAGAEGDEQRG